MFKKYKEDLRKLLRKLVWWQPVLFVILMFAIGLYANYQNKAGDADYRNLLSTVASSTSSDTGGEAVTKLTESAAQSTKDSESTDADLPESMGADSKQSTQALSTDSAKSDDAAIQNKDGTDRRDVAKSVSVDGVSIKESGTYTSKEEVALYIHTYGKLPSNYITKAKAKERGWNPHSGNLGRVLKGMSIGGDYFGNREGILPEKDGRRYYECDIDYTSDFRNEKRIVYSNDGLIFYTEDHYETFEQLY